MLETNPLTPRINNLNNGGSYSVGDVKHSFLSEAQFQAEHDNTWILADGSLIGGSDLAEITGWTNAPDSRGLFLRSKDHGAGRNPDGDVAVNAQQGEATKKNGLSNATSGTVSANHNHYRNPSNITELANTYPTPGSGAISAAYTAGNQAHQWNLTNTQNQNHTHSVGMNNGDNETRPQCLTINMFVKINREPTI